MLILWHPRLLLLLIIFGTDVLEGRQEKAKLFQGCSTRNPAWSDLMISDEEASIGKNK